MTDCQSQTKRWNVSGILEKVSALETSKRFSGQYFAPEFCWLACRLQWRCLNVWCFNNNIFRLSIRNLSCELRWTNHHMCIAHGSQLDNNRLSACPAFRIHHQSRSNCLSCNPAMSCSILQLNLMVLHWWYFTIRCCARLKSNSSWMMNPDLTAPSVSLPTVFKYRIASTIVAWDNGDIQ